MKRITQFFMATSMLFALGAGYAQAGSIVLTGHDPDFHSASGDLGEINFNQKAIQYVMDPLFNPFKAGGIDKFLFVQSQISPPGGHVDGLLGMTASGYTLGTDFDVATAATLNAALDLLGISYSALVVASDFGGILTQAELNILNSRSTDIISFLNNGGGVYAMAESNATGLTPAGGHFGFLPFATTSTLINYCGPTSVTAFGASNGFADMDVCADHNYFTGTYGLSIVDTIPGTGEIISLAGRGRTTPHGVPEPTSILLMGVGLIGLVSLGKRKLTHQA